MTATTTLRRFTTTTTLLPFALIALAILLASTRSAPAGEDDSGIPPSLVQQGFDISPIPVDKLDLSGKSRASVGLGSYLVNAVGDCSGCHSFPQYLTTGNTSGSNPAAGDPFLGGLGMQSVSGPLVANFNVLHYLGGGQCFGPFMARNLTPESNGLPEGLTEDEFVKIMRTGEDIHCEKEPSDPICSVGPDTPLLQVMPWPTYHGMTDLHLRAIYAYLKAIPPTTACNTVSAGCPGYSGAAAKSQNYAYPNTPDCPNPAPPQ
jgi:hypothetical protein